MDAITSNTDTAPARFRVVQHLAEAPAPTFHVSTYDEREPIGYVDLLDGLALQTCEPEYLRAIGEALTQAAALLAAARTEYENRMHRGRRAYDCGDCGFRIVDDSGDEGADGFFEAVEEHELQHQAVTV